MFRKAYIAVHSISIALYVPGWPTTFDIIKQNTIEYTAQKVP